MLSTMPKDGAAPTSPNAMPGGLGAILQQPGGAPKGASSRSIASIMDTARKMSDMQLADVLSGKSLDVPQYVAMTEAMGRKSLRTAMQGQQAQQQAKQPSVKDRLLAEETQATQMAQAPQGGIDQLPAPNMAPEGMAGGGIVAFVDNRNQPVREGMDGDSAPLTPEQVQQLLTRGSIRRSDEDTKKALAEQPYFGSQRMRPYRDAAANALNEAVAAAPKTTTAQAMAQDMQEGPKASAPAVGPTQAQRDAFYEKAAPKKSGIAAVLDGETEPKKAADDYLSKLTGLGEKTRSGIAGLKNEAQSQILLDAMSALMGNRNLAEAGGKFGTLAAGRVGAMGKESRALEKEANDYDLNLAKYQEAVKSGDQDRALKLREMLETSKYHQAMIGKPDSGIAMLNALQDPAKMALYKEMNAAKKPTDVIPRATALKEYNDLLGDVSNRNFKKQFPTFESYYNTLTGGSGGGGTPVKFLGFEK